MNLNKVILAGNLTHSPELRYTPNGVAVAMFDMATRHARVGSTASGEKKRNSTILWHLENLPRPQPNTSAAAA
jgi:single-stranded DNA-binding protein